MSRRNGSKFVKARFAASIPMEETVSSGPALWMSLMPNFSRMTCWGMSEARAIHALSRMASGT